MVEVFNEKGVAIDAGYCFRKRYDFGETSFKILQRMKIFRDYRDGFEGMERAPALFEIKTYYDKGAEDRKRVFGWRD